MESADGVSQLESCYGVAVGQLRHADDICINVIARFNVNLLVVCSRCLNNAYAKASRQEVKISQEQTLICSTSEDLPCCQQGADNIDSISRSHRERLDASDRRRRRTAISDVLRQIESPPEDCQAPA